VGFGAGLERLLLAMEDAGATAEPSTIDVFFALDDGAPRPLVASWLAELRRQGVAADTDYAGRSLKGQLTQSARLGSAATVIVSFDEAVLRRQGQADEPLALADVVGRLSP
jgi:histidyl-tRNA synthetase